MTLQLVLRDIRTGEEAIVVREIMHMYDVPENVRQDLQLRVAGWADQHEEANGGQA
jgi:hypothetical protein